MICTMTQAREFCGCSRFCTDPSGKYLKCKAHAIGSGSEGAETTLLEQYKADMSYPDAEKLALSTLKQVMEEKVGFCTGLLQRFTHIPMISTCFPVRMQSGCRCGCKIAIAPQATSLYTLLAWGNKAQGCCRLWHHVSQSERVMQRLATSLVLARFCSLLKEIQG